MKILVINDPHVALTPPRGCRPAYTEDVFNMLLEARQYAIDLNVDVTVCTGDWFHSKMNVAHRMVRRSIDILKDWPGLKLFIAGNHDMGAEGINSIANQPLGVLFEAGVCTWLREDLDTRWRVRTREGTGTDVYVQFSPANYSDTLDPSKLSIVKKTNLPSHRITVKVAHADLMPPRKEPYPWDVMTYDQIPSDNIDLFLNGHIHNDLGHEIINGCSFVNFGSIGRVARDEYNYNRFMRVALIEVGDVSGGDIPAITSLPLTCALPSNELYYEKTGADVELSAPMEKFARSIEQMLSVDETSIDGLLATVAVGVDKPVVRAVKQHLEEAGWE